jgi:hypothetical protein
MSDFLKFFVVYKFLVVNLVSLSYLIFGNVLSIVFRILSRKPKVIEY